jgi:hypothetical protein
VSGQRYLLCRAVGHAWWEADAVGRHSFGVPFYWRCDCGTLRVDLVSSIDGSLSARTATRTATGWPIGRRAMSCAWRWSATGAAGSRSAEQRKNPAV